MLFQRLNNIYNLKKLFTNALLTTLKIVHYERDENLTSVSRMFNINEMRCRRQG